MSHRMLPSSLVRARRHGRHAIVGALGAALALTASLSAPLLPTASAAGGLEITDVVIDKTIDYRGPGLRQDISCGIEVAFNDSTPLPENADGYYRVMAGGEEIAWAYPGDAVANGGCWGFSDGQTASLVIEEVSYDEDYNEYVAAQSAPFAWAFHNLAHPTRATMSGGKDVTKAKVPAVEVGKLITVSFEGEWAPDATVKASAMAGKGWLPLRKQGKGAEKIAVKSQPDGTFTFKVPKKLAGSSVYFSVKATDGLKRSQVTDYIYTWEPMLALKAKAKKTKTTWISSMGKKVMIEKTWLSVTKPKLTKAGKRAGVKFAYQNWWGGKSQLPWTSHTVRPTEFGGCPAVSQHIRVLAYKPGLVPAVVEYKKGPVCGRRLASEPKAGSVQPDGFGTATGANDADVVAQ